MKIDKEYRQEAFDREYNPKKLEKGLEKELDKALAILKPLSTEKEYKRLVNARKKDIQEIKRANIELRVSSEYSKNIKYKYKVGSEGTVTFYDPMKEKNNE